MKKIIVPVDFSETSINAAHYAAGIANQVADSLLILYHVFENTEAGSDGTPLQRDDAGRKAVMELLLQSVKNDIANITDVQIDLAAEEDNDFLKSLERYVRHNHIDVIVMGITDATRLSQIVWGSNTLHIIKKNIAPVIIVPSNARFTAAKNIGFICDLRETCKTIPLEPVRKMLEILGAKVHVVNINSEHYIEPARHFLEEKKKLDEMIGDFDPQYSFINMYDFVDAVDNFVESNNIDLLLTIPKNDSFFPNMLKTTHTAKLAYHSHVPVVAIHS
ncbi:MAG: universal stress protein [Bacteroidetes bacterium]|nr:universal stress protein [Bacteroidota bacterium]